MYFMNTPPRSNSGTWPGLNALMNILISTQVPKSRMFKCERMNGVRSSVRTKLQQRPRKLKNVFVTSFLEKSPRNVILSGIIVMAVRYRACIRGRKFFMAARCRACIRSAHLMSECFWVRHGEYRFATKTENTLSIRSIACVAGVLAVSEEEVI